jgi:hypothetical protein
VPIGQPPGSPDSAGRESYDIPLREMQDGQVPTTTHQPTEPVPAPAPAEPISWLWVDTHFKLIAYVLADKDRVNRVLKIFRWVVASVILLLAVVLAVAVLAPEAHVLIKFAGATLGVGVSGCTFAYLRRRWARKSTGKGQRRPTGGTKA